MKIGFNLFKTRPIEDSLDLGQLESKYGVSIPPLYGLFLKCFYPKIEIDAYLDTHQNEEYLLYSSDEVCNEYVMMDNFLDIETTLKDWNENQYYDQLYEWNFLPIAQTQTRYIFCVGLEGNMKDKIILDIESYDSEFEVVANDIFEFIRKIKYKELNGLWNGTKYNQLYKNWGEDFWRVRKEEEEK